MPRQQVGRLHDPPARSRGQAGVGDRLVGGVVAGRGLGVDGRADHERLVSFRDLFGDALPDPREPPGSLGERGDEGLDPGPTRRHRADRGDVEIAEDGHGDRAGNRRRGQHERMRSRALRAQGFALLHPEAMLLVDDDESQIGEGGRFAEQCVRADDDQRLAGGDPQRRTAPVGRGHLTGEQRRHELGREVGSEHPGDRSQVLPREHLGGRDQRGLPAALRRLQHGPQRDERLARADLALDEPVHRPAAHKVAFDLRADRQLIGRACERQRRVESLEQAAGRSGGRRERTHELPLLQECGLQDEGLVPAQRLARLLDLVLEVGAVDALDRGAGAEESVLCAQGVRERVGHVAETVQHDGDDLHELPARDRAGRRIDRDRHVRVRLGGRARRVFIVEELVVGIGELLHAAILADLAGEDAPAPLLEFLEPPGLVEERERQLALAVADRDFEDRALALLHPPFARAAHFGDDRDRLADRQRRDRRQLAAAHVPPRIVREQIAHCLHAECAVERCGGLAADGSVEP